MANIPKFARYARQADFDAEREAGSVADGIVCFVEDTRRIWLHGNYYTVDESEIGELMDGYLPLSGGTLTGDLKVDAKFYLKENETAEGYYVLSCNDDGEVRMTLWSELDADWLSKSQGGTVERDVTLKGELNVENTTDCKGNLLVGANMTVEDEVLLKSDLTVGGATTLNVEEDMAGDYMLNCGDDGKVRMTRLSNVDNWVSRSGDTVGGDLIVRGELEVDGAVNLSSLEETEDTDCDVLVQTSAGGGTVFGYSLRNLIETINAGSDTLSDGVYVAYQTTSVTESGTQAQNCLSTVDDYSGSGTPLGAYIVEGNSSLLVSLEGSRRSLPFGAGSGGATTSAYETDDAQYALQDMEGRENTRSTWENDTNTSRTWGYCRSFALGSIGTAKWWLPSMGELNLIRRNLDGVNAVFTKLGGSTIGASERLFSSTMYLIPYECWWLGMDGVSGYAQTTDGEEHTVVPVTSYNWQEKE